MSISVVRSRLSRLAAMLVIGSAALLMMASDWPTYLYDPQRTAASDETTLSPSNAAQLVQRWSFKTGGVVAASPTVVGGTVYVGSWDGNEYALDAATGAMKWKTYLGVTTANPKCFPATAGVSSTATVQSGVVYVGGGDAYWYALDATSGAVLWRVYTGDNSATGGHYNWSSSLIYNGYAYIGIASMGDCPVVQGQLLQVSLSSHSIVNTFNFVPAGQLGGGVWTSPALDSAANTIFVTTGTQNATGQQLTQALVALDASTLTLKSSWKVPAAQTVTDSDFGTSPILFNDATGRGLVAATNKNGITYAFDRTNVGAGPVWQRQIAIGGQCPTCGDGSASSGAFGQSTLYIAGGNTTVNSTAYKGSVRALDPATGNVRWEHGAPGAVVPALAYTNGLIVDGAGPFLEVLDASTGAQLYNYPIGGILYAAPIVSNGQIYTGGTDGNVYAFGLRTVSMASCPVGQLAADYYNNQTLGGNPTVSQCETGINHTLGPSWPGNGIGPNHFSVRWTGQFNVAAGSYTFTAVTDDGMRVWLDGNLLIDTWIDQSAVQHQATSSLTNGQHRIQVDYYQDTGGAVAQVSWGPPPTLTPTPAATNTPTPTPAPTGTPTATPTATPTPASCPAGQYAAQYFNNTTLSGNPVVTRCETSINYTLGSSWPGNGLGPNTFSVRWTGQFSFGAGTYTFTALTDDGMRVWIDGNALINAWQDQSPTQYQANATLTASTHQVVVEYYQDAGGATAQLSWGLAPAATPTPVACPLGQYVAQYYNDQTLTGSPTVTQCETGINYTLGSSWPGNGLGPNTFSVRWTGQFSFAAGTYAFTAVTDDGMRVWADGALLIDAWKDQSPTQYQATTTLASGQHQVKVEYYQDQGGATAQLAWQATAPTATVTPTSTPSATPAPTSTPTALPTPTPVPTPTATPTPTSTPVPTVTPTVTATPTATSTPTATAAPTSTATPTATPTPTPTATSTPTSTPAATNTPTPTPAPTGTPTATPTATPTPASCPAGQYAAQYFNNTTLSGNPVVTRCETSINYTLGSSWPGNGLGPNTFSVRWTGQFSFAAGTYTFTALTDDGMRVWVDGALLIDAWKDQSPTQYQGNVTLTAGLHLVKVEYYQDAGGATAQLSWGLAPAATPTPVTCPLGQYVAQYYNDQTLSGNPTVIQCETAINYTLGPSWPGNGLGPNAFSARWAGQFSFASGSYTFTAVSDDGMRVWLDGNLVIDGWKDQSPTQYQAAIVLAGGSHQVKVEYYQAFGGATAQLSWAASTPTPTPTP